MSDEQSIVREGQLAQLNQAEGGFKKNTQVYVDQIIGGKVIVEKRRRGGYSTKVSLSNLRPY